MHSAMIRTERITLWRAGGKRRYFSYRQIRVLVIGLARRHSWRAQAWDAFGGGGATVRKWD